jgi:hypothetical protein
MAVLDHHHGVVLGPVLGGEAEEAVESERAVQVRDPDADVIHCLNIDHDAGLSSEMDCDDGKRGQTALSPFSLYGVIDTLMACSSRQREISSARRKSASGRLCVTTGSSLMAPRRT